MWCKHHPHQRCPELFCVGSSYVYCPVHQLPTPPWFYYLMKYHTRKKDGKMERLPWAIWIGQVGGITGTGYYSFPYPICANYPSRPTSLTSTWGAVPNTGYLVTPAAGYKAGQGFSSPFCLTAWTRATEKQEVEILCSWELSKPEIPLSNPWPKRSLTNGRCWRHEDLCYCGTSTWIRVPPCAYQSHHHCGSYSATQQR